MGNALVHENEQLAAEIRKVSTLEVDACYATFNTRQEGLTDSEVEALRTVNGLNVIQGEKVPSWIRQLVRAFVNPFNGILLLIVIVSIVTNIFFSAPADQNYSTVYVIFGMILLSSLLRFWQEYSGNKAAQELKAMIKSNATVMRNGKEMEVDIKELVPGDIVSLAAGDMIPADCRILHSKDLFISQSILTGESMPAEKNGAGVANAPERAIFELENICFMGTNVLSGSAGALVIATGNRTLLGSVNKEITTTEAETSFDRGVNSVSWLLVKFMIVMVPLVFLVNLLTKGHWLDALLFSVAVAVGLTPEMLPMIVTANLSRGAVRMSRRKVIVKRLNAIQNFGAMDVLCTDKTGTLTLDQIVLEQYLNIYGAEDKEVLKWAFLNSYYQTGLKNLMDVAVLQHKEWEDHLDVQNEYKKIDEIPFDFQRRRMSVVLERPTGEHVLITKGAVEEMLSLCSHAIDPGQDRKIEEGSDNVVDITQQVKDNILNTCKSMNEQGLRVLLIGMKGFANRPATYSVHDECDMTLVGFIGFLDPAKPSAKPAIQTLEGMGIIIKVLTGDNAIVTKKICNDVGIPVSGVISGSELDEIDDAALRSRVENIQVFAKLNPAQKSRIIKALQKNGHTIGYMGDGINDAGALKSADVGVSVDSAVDIAKESADIILLEKDLMVLGNGVRYGRQTFGNIMKYIKMAASSNFGNMFSMVGASALFPFLPMLPVQLLVQNLLYDFSQTSIPWDRMDEDYLAVPRKWEASNIARFMFFIGPVSSLFDYITFAVLYFVFTADTVAAQGVFQSGWFVEGLLSQTLIVHMIRTRRLPFIQSSASPVVIVATLSVIAAGILLPYSPLAGALGFAPLPALYFLWLSGILVAYCVLTQTVKAWYIKKFSQWL